ncbi:MAG: GCN5-related N-acetyltransferase [Symbiobacteriaceae bacterium]|jgi:GNAT superfamily N-acetyltransferase|nr:GCN5-related N-acetyltransferase [Symbiobacteriaceae bacterium]
MPDSFQIRPFNPATDFPGLAQLITEIHDEHLTPESLANDYATLDPKYAFSSWIVEIDGQIVGVGLYQQFPGRYHPRKFHLDIGVHPSKRGCGIGRALYQHLRDLLEPQDPISLSASTREDRADSVAFLERRGFKEKLRNWESHFDLTAFNPAELAEHVAAAEAAGYAFRSYPDLAGDPERDRKLYEMMMVARRDIPSPEPLTDISFEHFMKGFDRPTFLPEAWYIAIKDSQYVGVSNIWTTDEAEVLDTGLTAVLREHRRAGVAKALKVKALGAVKALGRYRKVKTWNATTNAPMLAINQWLGFVRQPAWITFLLQLKAEE